MITSSTNIVSLAIVGDGSVGKSSIVQAFRSDGFAPVYKQTVGVDFYEKILDLKNNSTVSLRVWDVGGQSINSKNLEKYLSSSHVVFITYDVTNLESFSNLDDWLNHVRKYSKAEYIYLLGNKVDMIISRQVHAAKHEAFIRKNMLSGGFFVSAKTGENVVKSFFDVAGKACGTPLTAYELAFHDKVMLRLFIVNYLFMWNSKHLLL